MAETIYNEPLTVTVFIDVRSSLRRWDALNELGRNSRYYNALAEKGLRLNLISYGGREEREYASAMPGVRILGNWLGLPMRIYQRRVFQVHAGPLLRSQIIRTHDTHAILAALRAHWAWRIPLVFRMGYFWSTSAAANPQTTEANLQEAWRMSAKLSPSSPHFARNVGSSSSVAERVRRRQTRRPSSATMSIVTCFARWNARSATI